MNEKSHELTDPASFDFWAHDVVRFGDMDATGHVNNVSFARYVETGRVPFMRAGFLPAYDDRQRFVVGNLSIRYRAQAFWPADVKIGTRVARLGNTSITLGHGVFIEDACIATAETVMVYIVHGKSSPLPDEVRATLTEKFDL